MLTRNTQSCLSHGWMLEKHPLNKGFKLSAILGQNLFTVSFWLKYFLVNTRAYF